MLEQMVTGFLIFVVGLIIGSFLNVCIVRMPQEKSVITPRSSCVHCGRLIPWYDNIPILSYLLLRGRCRFCRQKISFRYMLVELITALSFLGFYLYFGLQPVVVAYAIMLSGFIVATFVDFQHRIIPDEITIGGMFCGIFLSMFIPALHPTQTASLAAGRWVMWILLAVCFAGTFLSEKLDKKDASEEDEMDRPLLVFIGLCLLTDLAAKFFIPILQSSSWRGLAKHLSSLDAALIGLLVGSSVIYVMGLLGDIIFRKESMGGGDIKLMAMIGAFLGWKLAVVTFFLAPFFGMIYGIIEKIRTKDSAIAYGPFIVAGALLSLFYGDQILSWLISSYIVTYNIR